MRKKLRTETLRQIWQKMHNEPPTVFLWDQRVTYADDLRPRLKILIAKCNEFSEESSDFSKFDFISNELGEWLDSLEA
jgi:hypothetical protein